MSKDVVLRMAVPAPLQTYFDYLPPEGIDPTGLCPGQRFMLPFGRGERCGVLLAVVNESAVDKGRLRRASRRLDREPLLGAKELELLLWASDYYHHPVGEVVAAALPLRLRKGKPLLAGARPGWRLTAAGREQQPDELKRAPRQAAVLRVLQESSDGVLAQEEIYGRCDECRGVLRTLAQKDWIESCTVAMDPSSGGGPSSSNGSPHALNSAQQAAVEAVLESGGGFQPFLLDGITGSGKTEVYLSLVEKMLEQGRQVLILVPEIGLTPQLMDRFQHRLAVPMALLHSGLSDLERERAWLAAAKGEAQVVIGTRSAVFTPIPNLGLVVVDEEHDLSFKQQEGFRYSARDLALVLGQQRNCPVLLGSATPSLESLSNAAAGRFQHLLLPERAGKASPPRLDLLDVRSVRLDGGLSPTMVRMVSEELDAGNQVLLFLNRRGYAPQITCYDCGWVAECRRCDARMTLHLGSNILWCHHCGSQRRTDEKCPECGGVDLHPLGQGTERLQEVLQKRFPEAGIARIDRDSTRHKGSLEQLLGDIHKGEYSLLLGTQLLAKGHHFPHVTLVGILDVDQGLFGADFRAAERMAQLVVQVSGRAGRAEKPGRVIIQTRHPDHPLLQTLIHQGYDAFAGEALNERRLAGLPPFSYQVLMRAEAPKEGMPKMFLEQALELVEDLGRQGLELWGPVPAPMERRAGRYRAHLLIQATRRSDLQWLLKQWLPRIRELKSAGRVRWSLDVDPQEML
jgi:primosomal protein N' (replication factor Y)